MQLLKASSTRRHCFSSASQWVSAKSEKSFGVPSPATGEVIGNAPECNLDDLAFPIWRAYSGRQRGRIIRKLFDLIAENMVDVGTIITAGNGKARPDGEGEAMFAAGFFEWFSEEAPRSYGDIAPHSAPNSRIQILKQPVGVCGLITPWKVPIAMAARTVVLKSDGITPFATNVLAVKR
ncbi:succinate-semialdehyde dehydrogenase [Metarhizium rileyi]|uniref:Succinate-semialdehyde dehydrogenase n=1 Tax=Metarhizium rileyi (strain RCEF 4871) TaxID=1649241 RepID=A0A167CJB2_METRR|nr:succinate-semialdehyde dehydrogenase [Metarhizium rileyi RCEF 4871]